MNSVHWIPAHRDATDKAIFAQWQPPFVKIVSGGGDEIPYVEDVPASARIIVRNWALSEQFNSGFSGVATRSAMFDEGVFTTAQNGTPRDQYVHPVDADTRAVADLPTPEQAADAFVQWADRCSRWALSQRGIPKDRLLFEGVNEPLYWVHGYVAYNRLETARLVGMHKLGLHSVIHNSGVGWPGNNGQTDAPVLWAWSASTFNALGPGDVHGYHGYWAFEGWQQNFKWWAGRTIQCPDTHPIVLTEMGVDAGVIGAATAKQGWWSYPGLDSLDAKAQRAIAEWWAYNQALDERHIGSCWFTYDSANREDWGLFQIDLAAFIDPLLAKIKAEGLAWAGGTPPPVEPPVEPPIVIPPNAAPQIVGTIVSQAPNAGTSYVCGKAWRSGVKVAFAWRGQPALAETLTGPHAGYPGWVESYYSFPLFVQGQTPCKGEWDVWCIDEAQVSTRVPFATTGPGNGVNQVEVNFDLIDVPPVSAYATLEEALRGEAEKHDVLSINPDAALAKAADPAPGPWPTSNEFELTFADVVYVAQRFRYPRNNMVLVLYCKKGFWSEVKRLAYTG
jgi:hypothetical protein